MSLIYYDNAATSWPKPKAVTERMTQFLNEEAANPGRSGHKMAVDAEKALNNTRLALTKFIGGTDHSRLIFAMNTTDALNIALKGFLRAGDHVITTTAEHNSISRPLQAMADSKFITLTRVPFNPETGVINPADIEKALTPKTKLIAMTHASNVTGIIQPIEAVGKIAKKHHVKFLVDAAQTIGIVPLHVNDMHIDLLAFPGHKSLLGPTGTGGLYVNTTLNPEDLQPFREGGTGGDSKNPHQPTEFPHLLEGGTPNTVGIAGLGAALDYVIAHDPAKTLAHERHHVQAIIDTLKSDNRFTLYGPHNADCRVGTISFNIAGQNPADVAAFLESAFQIAVRQGLHCAPYAHKTLGTYPAGTIRISPGHFNTDQDLATLLEALTAAPENLL